MRIRLGCSLLLAFSFSAVAAPMTPTTLFSSFGPGQTYDETTAYSLGGRTNDYSQAAAFTPGVTASLYQINLPLSWVIQSNAVVWLMTSVDGRPGVALEEFTITGITPMPEVWTLLSVVRPVLTAGTQYWIVGHDAAGPDGRVAWHLSPSATGSVATRYGSNPWPLPTTRALPAFDVLGVATPEPASVAMFALVALALLGRRALTRERR